MDTERCARCSDSECLLLERANGSLYCDACLEAERERLGFALDELGFGSWELEATGGGCHAWVCRGTADGRYVMVTGEDVLDGFGDPSDFGDYVTVGLYGSEQDDADDIYWADHLQEQRYTACDAKGNALGLAFDADGIALAVGRMMEALGLERVGNRVAYTVTLEFVAESPIMSDVVDAVCRDLSAQIEDCPTPLGVVGSVSVSVAGRRLAGGE